MDNDFVDRLFKTWATTSLKFPTLGRRTATPDSVTLPMVYVRLVGNRNFVTFITMYHSPSNASVGGAWSRSQAQCDAVNRKRCFSRLNSQNCTSNRCHFIHSQANHTCAQHSRDHTECNFVIKNYLIFEYKFHQIEQASITALRSCCVDGFVCVFPSVFCLVAELNLLSVS